MDKEQQITPEEKHEIWMKNSGYLYDRLVLHRLKWPSLTFQWLPTIQQTQVSTIYQCLFATHTSGNKSVQHIYIGEVQIPNFKDMEDKNPQMNPSSVRKIQQFNHQSQINKARYWEFDPSLIAARVQNGPISIFRRGNQYPQLLLSDVNFGSGFALQWSNYGLLAGDHNGVIAFWENLQNKPSILQYKDKIEDTKFFDQNTISTVADDGFLCFWDIRTQKICMEFQVSNKEVYCQAINPENKCLILTGGEDSIINLWDIRNFNQKLFHFESHENSVLSMQWSPKTPSIFASGSLDCKVKIWDLLRVGFQIPKDNSGTDELLFTHEGHLGQVSDLCWNKHNMLLGSTEEVGNTLQFYEISNCIQDIQYTQDIEYLRSQCLA